MLQDVHIIRFYGSRTDGDQQFLFLEYASGGELFDKIGKVCFSCMCFVRERKIISILNYFIFLEPDSGMSQMQAQKYFKQLLDGVVSYPNTTNIILLKTHILLT